MERDSKIKAKAGYGDLLVVATCMRQRMIGFLAARPKRCILLISPCRSIHTFGMKEKLDIAFFDRDGAVLYAEREVAPARIIRCKGAVGVLERRFKANRAWYREGDKVMLYV